MSPLLIGLVSGFDVFVWNFSLWYLSISWQFQNLEYIVLLSWDSICIGIGLPGNDFILFNSLFTTSSLSRLLRRADMFVFHKDIGRITTTKDGDHG